MGLFLPFYAFTEQVRKVLLKNKLDVKKCENIEESQIIIDAGKAYFVLSTYILSFIASLTKLAKEIGKNGLAVFEDIGLFYYYKLNDIVSHEASLSSSYKPWVKTKVFCLYNKLDYNPHVITKESYIQKSYERAMITKSQSFISLP